MPDQYEMARSTSIVPRKKMFVFLFDQIPRTVRSELETIQKKERAGEAISYTTWDDTFASEEMKKRLEFLSWYATNGESKEELRGDNGCRPTTYK